jgi:hypothetical protein
LAHAGSGAFHIPTPADARLHAAEQRAVGSSDRASGADAIDGPAVAEKLGQLRHLSIPCNS